MKRKLIFASLLSVMSLLLVSSPGVSAFGQEIYGTQLVEDLPAATTSTLIRVASVEDFDAIGGFAVIDHGTPAEEWVSYVSIDAAAGILDGVVRLEPTDHLSGAWVQPATASSTIPDLGTPEAWSLLGPLPQPVIDPITVDPPDAGPTVIDSPDLDPVGTDPAPIDVAGPDPDPVGADAPPVHVDGVDPAPVFVDPDPLSVDGVDPAPVFADPDPVAVDGVDPAPVVADPDPVAVDGIDPAPVFVDPDPIAIDGRDPEPIGIDVAPIPPLELDINRDPVCTPPVTIGGGWTDAIREAIEGLFQTSQASSTGLSSDAYASYLSEWVTYVESTNGASTAWTLIYQLDETLAELQRQGVAASDPVFAELTQLTAALLAQVSPDAAVASSASLGEIGEIMVPEICLSSIDLMRTPEVDPPPVDVDPDPIPGVYQDPSPIDIDPAPLPDVYEDPSPVGVDPAPIPGVYQDPSPISVDPAPIPGTYQDLQPIGTDLDPISSIDYDPQPVEVDMGKLPDVYEDPDPIIVDPIEVDDQTIDPPDPGPATDVDAAAFTESLLGGAGLPVGVKVWGTVPIIDVPVSEPYPRSAFAPAAQSTAVGPGEGAWSCYYYETTSANGGFIEGEPPDTNYAVDTALGARTYNRAYNLPYDLTRNTSHSWAAAGQEVTYQQNRGLTRRGAVIIPWKVAGRFDLGVSCATDGTCGQAEARTNVEIVLRDVTDGAALARRPVPQFDAEGDTVANYGDQGEEKIEFTYQPGHTYKALIKITGYSSTDIPLPGLGARATNDAFQGQRRAYMEYVQWQLYGNARVNCG